MAVTDSGSFPRLMREDFALSHIWSTFRIVGLGVGFRMWGFRV